MKLSGIMLEGESLAVGRVVKIAEIGEQNAVALAKEGAAAYCDADGTEDTTPAPAAGGGRTEEELLAEVQEKQRKALDTQYKADDLKGAAKLAGVDFAFDVSKKALIAAILAQGKADQLIK